ncbi:hypothetical protein EVAR_90402_1 [Eumeta japonica]|uniref:Uncharacterized protein n=1 Tax=Eumeta variegata TaxID=151549 RepID=A0A4C1Y8N4_EUMVA|nr:hypothetical protein EVAR_90402_1 [Eumeta japonica]
MYKYNARNSAAVKLVTKASQWREKGTRGRRRLGPGRIESAYYIIRSTIEVEAGQPSESRWSPPPMDPNPRGFTNELGTVWRRHGNVKK